MGPFWKTLARRARLAGAAGTLLAAGGVLFGPAGAAGAQAGCTRVMGAATTSAAQQAGWFATTGRQPKLDVSVLDLATMFIEEGRREGVRGDIAFAQAIVETGYFGFSPSVPPALHNYSGIGATGGGVQGAGFPDARTGVRAQVQHLRAYADPALRSAADLKAPLVDPRFGFLVPNSRTVPCWEQFGGGVWAADPSGYGPRVLSVHQRIAAVPVPKVAIPAPAPPETAAPAPTAPAVVVPVELLTEVPAMTEVLATELTMPVPTGVATFSVLDAQPALTSSTAGGGVAGAVACVFGGGALLTICTTLWWHGRRFARPL